ncbi:hypothetical protein [Gordonia soli]|uniref:Peptidase M28 domain-containing protein n=1 Tax=Gordonia soli NBRC 108243 TaxID=1223545 RepID=M0QHL2_9ACTN|nr:hypothetical protein [Gordonia soli]GAC68043.1 hypothetical protein GS4_11_03150 [Gordonia soli NBRC 108243]
MSEQVDISEQVDPTAPQRRGVSRRRLLQAAGVGLAGAALWSPTSSAGASPPGLPRGLSVDDIWDRNLELADHGPRLTGNPAHRRFIDSLAADLDRIGLHVHRDRLTFDRWDPMRWELAVDGLPVPLAFYYPYSGVTGPDGVTTDLQYLGVLGQFGAWEPARGKIAVVEVPVLPIPITVGYRASGRYPSDAQPPDPIAYLPSVSDAVGAPTLEGAVRAGVCGVICIRTGISDGLAADQYAPFTTGYQGCPAVWVGPAQAERVRASARRGASARLVMHARRALGAATETIFAVLPGANPAETVIVNTHTDGPNVAEENGGIGLISLARQFAQVPISRRRRTLVFVFVTGHFQLPQFETEVGNGVGTMQASSRWMRMHPEWWDGKGSHRKAVAALTLEHLGCREWLDDAGHRRYAPTGRPEVGWCYTTTPAMRSIYLAGARGTANERTFTCDPLPALYFGEGAPFYKSGIATMSLIPSQTYLTAAPADGAIEKLDKNLMAGQIETFANAIRALDQKTARQIGTPILPI